MVKKPKLIDNGLVTDVLPTNGTPEEPATDLSELPGETPTNTSGKPATSKPTVDKAFIESPNPVEAPKSFNTADLPTSPTHIQIEGGEIMVCPRKVTCFQ